MKIDILKQFKNFPLRAKKDFLKVGVIAGGISSEREVSLSTGKEIYNSLKNLNYNAEFIDFDNSLIEKLKKIDTAFIALHGKYGEDGTVQGLLEILKIPYTGSGVMSSAVAMDKIYSKRIFKYENIPTPAFLELNLKTVSNKEFLKSEVKTAVGYPVIVKPNRGGSTIGVTIVKKESELADAVKLAFNFDDKVLVEKYIYGRLLTVGIIGDEPVALPVLEIRPKSGFYDYASKYTPGLTEYLIPAPIKKTEAEMITDTALKCHRALECSALSRVDLILGDDKKAYFLEVNTIPGMTPTSLVPKAASCCGINFDMLVEIILNCASLKL